MGAPKKKGKVYRHPAYRERISHGKKLHAQFPAELLKLERELPTAAITLYLHLYLHCLRTGSREIEVPVEDIASERSWSVRQVELMLKELVEVGAIARQRRRDGAAVTILLLLETSEDEQPDRDPQRSADRDPQRSADRDPQRSADRLKDPEEEKHQDISSSGLRPSEESGAPAPRSPEPIPPAPRSEGPPKGGPEDRRESESRRLSVPSLSERAPAPAAAGDAERLRVSHVVRVEDVMGRKPWNDEKPKKREDPKRQFVNWFRGWFRERYGEEYLPTWERDMAIAGQLLDVYGLATAKEIVEEVARDEWLIEKRITVTLPKVRKWVTDAAGRLGERRKEREKAEIEKIRARTIDRCPRCLGKTKDGCQACRPAFEEELAKREARQKAKEE